MALIGVIPTNTSIELRDPDGDCGTIPAATKASAGVMTAAHVRMLEEVFTWLKTNTGASAPVVIERPAPDMSQYLTKLEAKAILQRMPTALDMSPQIQALRGELMALHDQVAGQSRTMLAAPPETSEAVDTTARTVIDHALTQFEAFDHRLRHVESVIDTLRLLADVKGQEQAA